MWNQNLTEYSRHKFGKFCKDYDIIYTYCSSHLLVLYLLNAFLILTRISVQLDLNPNTSHEFRTPSNQTYSLLYSTFEWLFTI
jgi:hypothetical protein